VLPGNLRLPPEREEGADPFKLARQIQEYGDSFVGMPSILVREGADGELQIYNGVTRATRAFYAHPEMPIAVEVTGIWPEWDFSSGPTIAEVAHIDF
jgi:hypothetical protein